MVEEEEGSKEKAENISIPTIATIPQTYSKKLPCNKSKSLFRFVRI